MSNARELLDRLYMMVGHAAPRELQDRIRAELARPEPEHLHFVFKFPNALRKMWSGTEIQLWLDSLPPLYTSPPARKGLGREHLAELALKANCFSNPYEKFARLIEQAHNIGIPDED
jgi:hypothetical protein